MVGGAFTILCFFFMRETYAVIILQRKTLRLQKETGNLNLRSKLDVGLSPRDFFFRSIIRPAKMLILSPIVLSASIYIGVVYGYLYLLFTTFTPVFEETYGFSPGNVGLTYLVSDLLLYSLHSKLRTDLCAGSRNWLNDRALPFRLFLRPPSAQKDCKGRCSRNCSRRTRSRHET